MSKELKQMLADLSAKKAEATAIMNKTDATAEEFNAKAAEIKALNARIALQKQTEEPDDVLADDLEDDETYSTSLEAIRKQYPDTLNRFEKEAQAAERKRIQDIDAISGQISPALVDKAKYKTSMTAKDLAFAAMKANGAQGDKFLEDFANDTAVSGVKEVGAAPGDLIGDSKNQERAKVSKSLADRVNKKLRR